MTKGILQARNFSEIEFTETPPSFHKIRSLSGRMHKKEFGKDFAHRLLGHKSERMTAKYPESRKRNS
ncbi:tyrosine-type recombinase/integrase [Enterobacter cloacae]|uniref:tyrosine-type recombinase/integrase n=1 Tax=Enterobacter cloacae TaxID=550 RepID=UPI0002FC3707